MAYCLRPFVKDGMELPCGKCYECYMRRISGWSFRLMREGRNAPFSFFITLTYNTEYVPITKKGYMSLEKTHTQNYWKRVRKALGGAKLRYYVAGEYGSKKRRPHYHAIVFCSTNCEKALRDNWKFGSIHVGAVSGASIGYTLKYMAKLSRIPEHKNDDRVPEFSCMSKGLGANYLTPQMIAWHLADEKRYYLPMENGKKIGLPRYYKDKIYGDDKEMLIAEVRKLIDQKKQEEMDMYGVENLPKRKSDLLRISASKLKRLRVNEKM